MSDLLSAINKLMQPLRTRIMLLATRAVVTKVDDSTKMQSLQVTALSDEVQDNIEYFQQFGFTAVPLPGAEALIIYLGGNREHGIAVALDDRTKRKKDLTAGQSAQYDANGSFLLFSADGKALLEALVEFHVKSALVKLGKGSIQEKILNGETFQTRYNQHTHLAFGVPTAPPTIQSLPTDLSQAVTAATLEE